MNTAVKFALVSVAIGAVVYFVRQAGNKINEWANKLSVRVTGLGIPVFYSGQLSVPVNLVINNPLPAQLPINSLQVGLFILRGSMFEQFGQANQPAFTLTPGDNSLTLRPVVDLSKIQPNAPTWQTALNILASNQSLATVKIVTRVNVQGITFDKEETRSLTLNQLFNAAA